MADVIIVSELHRSAGPFGLKQANGGTACERLDHFGSQSTGFPMWARCLSLKQSIAPKIQPELLLLHNTNLSYETLLHDVIADFNSARHTSICGVVSFKLLCSGNAVMILYSSCVSIEVSYPKKDYTMVNNPASGSTPYLYLLAQESVQTFGC